MAHVIGGKAKQAYRRSDALEKRRRLMEAWAAYCERTTGNVVQIGERKTLTMADRQVLKDGTPLGMCSTLTWLTLSGRALVVLGP